MLFTLRHRQGNRGVQLSMIELKEPTEDAATNLRLAEEIGKAYCNRMLNSLFIRVENAVVADETLLSPADYKRIVTPPKPKEKQRLKPGEQVPDNKPENEVTQERPKFDGNLDSLELGDDEQDEEGASNEDTGGAETEESGEESSDDEQEEEQPVETAKQRKAREKREAKGK